jgi:hypothetical protein
VLSLRPVPTAHAAPTMNATAIALPKDSAVRGILFSNLLAIGFAVFDDAGLLMLLWPYWAQSVIIGFYAYRRIAKLQTFKTDGLKINGRSVDPTPETRSYTKNFFALHYGFFHVGYFIFLGAMTGRITGEAAAAFGPREGLTLGVLSQWDFVVVGLLALSFAIAHRSSHQEHVEADLAGEPNIGALMFMPYLRIIPMHITIILGAVVGNGGGAILFGGLKTVADVAMHKVEHHMLQKLRAAESSPQPAR